jgi:chromosome segregation ATPase
MASVFILLLLAFLLLACSTAFTVPLQKAIYTICQLRLSDRSGDENYLETRVARQKQVAENNARTLQRIEDGIQGLRADFNRKMDDLSKKVEDGYQGLRADVDRKTDDLSKNVEDGIRGLKPEIKEVERKMDDRFRDVERKIDDRFRDVERKMDDRSRDIDRKMDDLSKKFDRRFDKLDERYDNVLHVLSIILAVVAVTNF